MYAYLKGTLAQKTETYLVIDVGGVGYKVFCPARSIEKAVLGEPLMVYTHLSVKEDAMDLYGFFTDEDLHMFELLITINRIGPKAALMIMSTLSYADLAVAVATGNAKAIAKAPGIGGKTAERIILELKDKIKNEDLTSGFTMDDDTSAPMGAAAEAISALVVLGYNSADAQKAVKKVYTDGMDIEEIIKKALKAFIK